MIRAAGRAGTGPAVLITRGAETRADTVQREWDILMVVYAAVSTGFVLVLL